MEVSELRIGNYIYKRSNRNEPLKVDIQLFTTVCRMPTFYKPVPISEEWLLKLGFIKSDEDLFELSLPTDRSQELFVFEIWTRIETGMVINIGVTQGSHPDQTDVGLNHIKYVHQLQNLYFAITGEELEVKESTPGEPDPALKKLLLDFMTDLEDTASLRFGVDEEYIDIYLKNRNSSNS
jgi:ribosomal protein L33